MAWPQFSWFYSFFTLNKTQYTRYYSIENDKRTLTPGKKKADWLKTSELQGEQYGEFLVFCYLPYKLS